MHDGKILVIENTLSDDEILEILNRSNLYFRKAGITLPDNISGKLSNHRRVWTAAVNDCNLKEKLNQLFREASNMFNITFDATLTDFAVMQYKSSDHGYYDWHIDTFDKPQNGKNRKLSMTVMLDESYTGGCLCFENKKFENLRPGTCVIFSSDLKHCVEPVTAGTRHSLVSWAYEKTLDSF